LCPQLAGFLLENKKMKTKVQQAIRELYSLMKKAPKLNVESVKQHIHTFKDKPENFTSIWSDGIERNISFNKLKKAVHYVKSKKQCTWCVKSADDVQSSLKNEWHKKEYDISALCGECQDNVFTQSSKGKYDPDWYYHECDLEKYGDNPFGEEIPY
jgi:hypothetical protein